MSSTSILTSSSPQISSNNVSVDKFLNNIPGIYDNLAIKNSDNIFPSVKIPFENSSPSDAVNDNEGQNSLIDQSYYPSNVAYSQFPATKIGLYELIIRQLHDDGLHEISNSLSRFVNIDKNDYVDNDYLFKFFEKYEYMGPDDKLDFRFDKYERLSNEGSGIKSAEWYPICTKRMSENVNTNNFFWTIDKLHSKKSNDKSKRKMDLTDKLATSINQNIRQSGELIDQYHNASSDICDSSRILLNGCNIRDVTIAKGHLRCEMYFNSRCLSVATDRNFSFVAAGSENNMVKIMEVPSSTKVSGTQPVDYNSHNSKTFEAHTAPVTTVTFHPYRPYCFSGSLDCTVKIYNISKSDRKIVNAASASIQDVFAVTCLSAHPSGDFLYVGSYNPIIRCYDLSTLNCYTSLNSAHFHSAKVNDIRCSGDGSIFVSVSNDGSIKLWDSVNFKLINQISNAHSGLPVTSVRFSSSERYILTSGCDGQSRLWDLRTGKEVLVIGNGIRHVDHAISTLLNDEKYTAHIFNSNINWRNRDIQIFDSYTGAWIATLEGIHAKEVEAMESSPTESSIITACNDGKCRAIDITFSAGQTIDEELIINEFS